MNCGSLTPRVLTPTAEEQLSTCIALLSVTEVEQTAALEEAGKELQAPPMEEEEGAEEASAVYNSQVNTRYTVLRVLAIAVPLK